MQVTFRSTQVRRTLGVKNGINTNENHIYPKSCRTILKMVISKHDIHIQFKKQT